MLGEQLADSRPRRVRVRPGGAWTVAAAAAIWLLALTDLSLLVIVVFWTSSPLLTFIVMLPSLLLMAWCTRVMTRGASGFVLDVAGIHGAAQRRRLVRWDETAALRWGRTKWWGRRNHQLVAALSEGRTIVVSGCRSEAGHDRIVAGLRRASAAGLLPSSVARADDLIQPYATVAARLDDLATTAPSR